MKTRLVANNAYRERKKKMPRPTVHRGMGTILRRIVLSLSGLVTFSLSLDSSGMLGVGLITLARFSRVLGARRTGTTIPVGDLTAREATIPGRDAGVGVADVSDRRFLDPTTTDPSRFPILMVDPVADVPLLNVFTRLLFPNNAGIFSPLLDSDSDTTEVAREGGRAAAGVPSKIEESRRWRPFGADDDDDVDVRELDFIPALRLYYGRRYRNLLKKRGNKAKTRTSSNSCCLASSAMFKP